MLILDQLGAIEFVREKRILENSIVFTNGCFDVLTAGHVSLLKFAASQGDCVIVGLNSDDSIRRLKGPQRPICQLQQRIDVLAAIRWVDAIIPFEADTPTAICEAIRPDVLVKGAEYHGRNLPGAEFCEKVALAPQIDGVSSTNIIRKIIQGARN